MDLAGSPRHRPPGKKRHRATATALFCHFLPSTSRSSASPFPSLSTGLHRSFAFRLSISAFINYGLRTDPPALPPSQLNSTPFPASNNGEGERRGARMKKLFRDTENGTRRALLPLRRLSEEKGERGGKGGGGVWSDGKMTQFFFCASLLASLPPLFPPRAASLSLPPPVRWPRANLLLSRRRKSPSLFFPLRGEGKRVKTLRLTTLSLKRILRRKRKLLPAKVRPLTFPRKKDGFSPPDLRRGGSFSFPWRRRRPSSM